jgi:hypothetical protein
VIRKIYIRHRENLPDDANNFAALRGFEQLGVETAPFHGFGDIDSIDGLGPEVGIHGFVGDAFTALKLIGAPLPAPLDYPEELAEFRQRRIWRTTLDAVNVGDFVKPVRHKLFTGRVWGGGIADRLATEGVPGVAPDEPVWCSEPVTFVAEFRCFVLEDKVLDVRRYKGDWSKAPDRNVVTRAAMAYGSAPAAYSLDWGVAADGRTVLVEANDAFALGAYGLDPVLYARMISARWEEMTKLVPAPPEQS